MPTATSDSHDGPAPGGQNHAESRGPGSANLGKWLVEAFGPEDGERLYGHCMRDQKEPLGSTHLMAAMELARVEVGPDVARPLAVAYMLLTAYYFLLDSGTDGHPDSPVDLADLTMLLSGAWVALREAGRSLDEERVDEMIRRSLARMVENAAAIRLEATQIGSWRNRDEEASRRSSVGRSSSALLLYELVCIVGGRDCEQEAIAILEEYLAVIQESDDLDDWRDDLEAGRWTPFLKRCAEAAGGEPTPDAVMGQVYLGGGYERQAANVIRRLGDLTDRLEPRLDAPSSRLLRCWAMQREMRERALTEWVATKLRLARGEQP